MANLQDAARRMYAAKGSLSTSAGDEAKKITTENQLKEDPNEMQDPLKLLDPIKDIIKPRKPKEVKKEDLPSTEKTSTFDPFSDEELNKIKKRLKLSDE
tara:strand:+ start:317 stop:613 length:297 start_codon:yes stop_codon:yes gene_type:complete